MRKIAYNILLTILLFITSTLLVSCKAITAQNIDINSPLRINGNMGINDYSKLKPGASMAGSPKIKNDFHENDIPEINGNINGNNAPGPD